MGIISVRIGESDANVAEPAHPIGVLADQTPTPTQRGELPDSAVNDNEDALALIRWEGEGGRCTQE